MHRLLQFEGKEQPLLPQKLFYHRLSRSLLAGLIVMMAFLLLGVLGYRYTCHFGWLDSLLNAAMILAGMGPVTLIETTVGKLFASFYALISGVVFISTIGLILAPVAHRIFHRFHLNDDDE